MFILYQKTDVLSRENRKSMSSGIIVCGLNGVGKSTLGKALSQRLGCHFIDIEDLYFPKTDSGYMYAAARSRDEVEELLMTEISANKNFVFAAIKCGYEKAIPFFKYAVLIEAPRELRLRRVKERSFRKFGERMLPGGDLYEREQAFFDLISSRAENTVKEWLKSFGGQVICIDGTKPINENINLITEILTGKGFIYHEI